MTNEIMATEGNELAASEETCLKIVEPVQNYSQIGKFMDKIIADGKDERINTRRVIAADIASTERVQKQGEQAMEACIRELQRDDLSEERKSEIICSINRMMELVANESEASREFQREQLERSRWSSGESRVLWALAAALLGVAWMTHGRKKT